jgi:rhamnose transport system permease protein
MLSARMQRRETRRHQFTQRRVLGVHHMGGLVGVSALLNAIRFSAIPGNSGVGLELKAIAAVVVGGAAITGGRGTLIGTLIGVACSGPIGTALTFLGINPFWEKAIQGAIILAALASDVALGRLEKNGRSDLAATSPA